jgi:hypothetical protein
LTLCSMPMVEAIIQFRFASQKISQSEEIFRGHSQINGLLTHVKYRVDKCNIVQVSNCTICLLIIYFREGSLAMVRSQAAGWMCEYEKFATQNESPY